MNFKPILLKKILDGTKTVTRRPVKGDKPCKYKVGHVYAIQPGMGRKTVGRIRVLSVEKQTLNCISQFDAQREGFMDVSSFKQYWIDLYGSYDWSQWVYRIEFELVESYGSICECCGGEGIVWCER